MSNVIAVAFMSVMIGSTAGQGAPTVAKETTIINGSQAMSVCRKMESNFHRGSITVDGETKISKEKFEGTVRRESSCITIPE